MHVKTIPSPLVRRVSFNHGSLQLILGTLLVRKQIFSFSFPLLHILPITHLFKHTCTIVTTQIISQKRNWSKFTTNLDISKLFATIQPASDYGHVFGLKNANVKCKAFKLQLRLKGLIVILTLL